MAPGSLLIAPDAKVYDLTKPADVHAIWKVLNAYEEVKRNWQTLKCS